MHPLIQYHWHALFMTGKEHKRRERSASKYVQHEMNHPGEYGSVHCLDYYKCIFLHVPKSAGLSVSKTLFGNFGPCHLNYDWFEQNFGKHTVKAYYKFTFVRNPWDRLYSAYFFLKKGGINANDAAFAEKHLSHVECFEQFILEWLQKDTMDLYWHFIPQYKFITSAKNRKKIMADFTGRFEKLDQDFKHVCKRLGVNNVSLLSVNVNNNEKNKYIRAYSKEMITKVAEFYTQDIELLKYNFAG